MLQASRLAAVAALAFFANRPGTLISQASSQSLPAGLEQYLATEVRLTAAERSTLVSGSALTKLMPSDESKEVFVFGAVWINASPASYVVKLKDIENFEKSASFHVTTKISDPPKLEDFAQMTLPEEDIRDLRRCRVGNCDVKLSAEGLQIMRTQVRWRTPTEKSDANAVFRRLAFEYVMGYRQGGNARLAVYRDSESPLFVANEFRSMIERAPSLMGMPDLQQYLLGYPTATLSGSSDFFYWQETRFGLKPTIRINHLVVQDRPGQTVVASKMLYATHYFWAALEQRLLQSDPARGPGFWFVTISRSRIDGIKGLIGRLARGRVRSDSEKGTLAMLKAIKADLERH